MGILSDEKQKWIEDLFQQWGAWEFSGIDPESQPNQLYVLMKSVEGKKTKDREVCSDDVGLFLNQLINYYVRKPCPDDYEYLAAHYIHQCSIYAIAKWKHKQNKEIKLRQWQYRIRNSIQSSQWIVAKMLESAVKNQKNVNKLQKLVFLS